MKIDGPAFQEMIRALEQVCRPERMRMDSIDRFPGPTPKAAMPALLCRLEAGTGLPPPKTVLGHLRRAAPDHFPVAVETAATTNAVALASWVSSLAVGLLEQKLLISLASGCDGSDDGAATFWIEDYAPIVVLRAIEAALIAVGTALEDRNPAPLLAPLVDRLDRICGQHRPNNESRILIQAARASALPYVQIAADRALWQFGWGESADRFWVTSSNFDGMVGQRMARDKDLTKRFLRQLGLPTPDWRLIDSRTRLRAAAEAVGWPCVAKPFTGGAGRGVTADIRDMATLERAMEIAQRFAPLVIVERHQAGSDYRLMVVDGRLAMAVRRDPPEVEGDGKNSVGQLIEALNAQREADHGYLEPVPQDDVVRVTLAAQGVRRRTILPPGKRILLRANANQATGGTCTDVLDRVHPQIRQMCEHMAAATGFRTIGIDYITTDITRRHAEVGGGFIEINATPGMQVLISAHLVSGDLGSIVIGKTPGRIPVRLLLVPQTQEAEIAGMLRPRLAAGLAAATAEWAQVGPFSLSSTLKAPGRVEALLRYPSVRRLAILWSAETLMRFGLPVDAVEQTIILGPAPPEKWLDLLRERSRAVTFVDSTAEAAANAFGDEKEARAQPATKTIASSRRRPSSIPAAPHDG